MHRFQRARNFLRSNAVGLLALFIVLGGTAVALPGKNRIDSGDIKQGQVRTLDLHRDAVTKSKLHANAVTGAKVRDDSLTDKDIDESTLELPPPAAGAIGERELADRERRTVVSAGELVPAVAGQPDIALQFGYPAVFYLPTEDRTTGALIEVPLDRAGSSGMRVSLIWDAQASGDVVWHVAARTVGPGTDLGSGIPGGQDIVASAPKAASPISTPALDISSATLVNGQPLAIQITRNADAPGDTMSSFAFLRLVEISYTATG